MVGIKSYGAYIPKLRLNRELIAKGWDIPGAPGTIAVANYDEDSLTMGVEAAADCLIGFDPAEVGGVFFASTSAPYAEKSAATLIATVLDTKPDIYTVDFANSLRASTQALGAALDAAQVGKAENIIVTSGETRVAEPISTWEQTLGDGAGAVMVGSGEGVIAEYLGSLSIKDEIIYTWRRSEKDHMVREFNPRVAQSFGYQKHMVAGIKAAMEKFDLTPDKVARAVYSAPDFRSHGGVAKRCGFDPASGQVQDALFAFVGGTGTAQPLMMLAGALQSGLKEGDIILLAHYADGVDVLVFRATAALEKLPSRRAISGFLASQIPLESFARFLRYRGIAEVPMPEDTGTPVQMWRDSREVYSLHGSKCNQCGLVRFPMERVCSRCKSRDDFTEIPLTRKGKVFTYIHDNLYVNAEMPTTLAVVDLEGGGRVFLMMTDRKVDEVDIGMEVELTFRKIHEGNHYNNYFWKCRPVR